MTGVLIRRGEATDMRERGHVKREAEIGVILSQPKAAGATTG